MGWKRERAKGKAREGHPEVLRDDILFLNGGLKIMGG